jgi:hypothetical protein
MHHNVKRYGLQFPRCFFVCLLGGMLSAFNVDAQVQLLDDFESPHDWSIRTSEGVVVTTSPAEGKDGKGVRLAFNFLQGTGYGGINKRFPMKLPENYRFTFWLKAQAPVNNFEFKLIDASGENVWWVNRRNVEFSQEWQQITIKKRHIQFAWGPTTDRALTAFDTIEFVVASATGGQGVIYLDQLQFEPLAPPSPIKPTPTVSVSSVAEPRYKPENLLDGDLSNQWRSSSEELQELILDLQQNYEYGGLIIDWDAADFARRYDVQISPNRHDWQTVYPVTHGRGGRRYIPLPETESRYIKLVLRQSSRGQGYAIRDIALQELAFSQTPESLFTILAKDRPRGYFPRYLDAEQSYWTITGVNNDTKEALIDEDSRVEVDHASFSVEPFIFQEGHLLTWNDGATTPSLEDGYLPIPAVTRRHGALEMETKIFAAGEAGKSLLYLNYTLKNTGKAPLTGNLYLAIRPFQVNTPWQFLNRPGGVAKIQAMAWQSDYLLVNQTKAIVPLTMPEEFGATEFDEGDVTDFLTQNRLPARKSLRDHVGYASGALRYPYRLEGGAEKTVRLAVPFHHSDPAAINIASEQEVPAQLQAVKSFWADRLNTVAFHLPPSGDRLVNTLRANLAYILINRDHAGIQPGSRSYERSWIRDGAMTSSALLKLGIQQEVRDFLTWYAGYQYDNGKVPCVVDHRGPDPTPEHDSHGQLIFGLYQYYLFTGDTNFLRQHFEHVKRAVAYMDDLVSQRTTDDYRYGDANKRALYGIFPESISHEGYADKPRHSYWDDFWGLKGYKDAVEIARVLGEEASVNTFTLSRDRFRAQLYNSLSLAMRDKHIDYLPGCVELGDFDPTSTAIAVYPVNELRHLPQPYAHNTFDRYYEYFQRRLQPDFVWKDYTPYEVRLVGTFIYLGQIERAHALLDFFFSDQRPPGWYHWAEIVRKGYRTPGFIGDMPHTWVGSDFISAARAMFVYEDELDHSLVIGAGLYPDWIDAPEGVRVRHLPTYYGRLDYAIRKSQKGYAVELGGDLTPPAKGIRLRNFKAQSPQRVRVNGTDITTYDNREIVIHTYPASIDIQY